ncbi:MAG: hypothetical protein ACSHWU_06610 [Marinicella sp.]
MPVNITILLTLLMLMLEGSVYAELNTLPPLNQAVHLEDRTPSSPYSSSTAAVMAIHSDGTRFIVGQLRGDVDFDPGINELIHSDDWGDPYLAIYPPNDAPVVHQFHNDQGGTAGELKEVHLDEDGQAYVLGEFDADFLVVGDGIPDLQGTFDTPFLAKVNPLGVVLWAFSLPDSPSTPEINAMAVNENRIVIGGKIGSAGADFDPDPLQVAFAASGMAGGQDPFIASYSLAGDFLWVRVMEQLVAGQSGDGVEDLQLMENNQLLVTGSFNGSTEFDASAGSLILSSSHTDAFIAHYDADGFPVWVKPIGGTGGARAYGELIASNGQIITVAGTFVDEIDFNPDLSTSNLISSNPSSDADRFIAAYNMSGDYQWANLIDGTSGITWGGLSTSDAGLSVLGGTGANFGGGHIDFDPGPMDSDNNAGGFMALYAADGGYLQAHSFDAVANVYISDVFWADPLTLYGCGRFLASFDVDPSENMYWLDPTTPSGHEIFFATWSDLIFEHTFD